jgi:hypothetical protein
MSHIHGKEVARHFKTLGGILLIVLATPVWAGDANAEGDWDIHIGLPFWAFGVEHSVGVNGREAETDEDFDDFFDILDFTAGLNVEARKAGWLLFANSQYAKVSTDAEAGGLLSGLADRVDLTTKELEVDFGLGFDVIRRGHFSLEPFVGGRLASVEVELEGDAGDSFDRSETWVDPIVGGIATFRFGRYLAVYGEADIGGFAVSSDITWQIQGGLELNILRWPYLRLGYRHRETDFEDDSFKYDIKKSGPMLELGLRF